MNSKESIPQSTGSSTSDHATINQAKPPQDSPTEPDTITEVKSTVTQQKEENLNEVKAGPSKASQKSSVFLSNNKPEELVKPGTCKLSKSYQNDSVFISNLTSKEKSLSPQSLPMESFLQRHPLNKKEARIWAKVYANIFSNVTVDDVKSCRLVCKLWNQNIVPLLDNVTCFNLNCDVDPELTESTSNIVLKPWKLFIPQKADSFYEYLEESSTRLRHWSMFKIFSASSADVKYILNNEGSILFRDSVRTITTLEISSCTLEFTVLFRLLESFLNLKRYHDIKNIYHEPIPIYTQVLKGITGGSTSPDTHTTEIDQEFIGQFRKYKLSPSALKIQDSGQGTSTSIFIYILPEVLVKNCVTEIEILAGSKCVQHGELTEGQREARYFWVAVGELLLYCKPTLKKLDIKCTNENSPMDAFELFLNSCTHYLSQASANDLSAMIDLSLDFKFFWISSPLFQTLLIPFINRCNNLQHLKMSSIIVKSKYEKRLEMLYPLKKECNYELGIHLSDLEVSDSPIPEMIYLSESQLYQDVVKSIHFSVHSPETTEFRKFLKINGEAKYENLTSFTLTIMSNNFNSLCCAFLPLKFPALTSITIIDGPAINYMGKNIISTERAFQHMSNLKLENDDVQLIIENYPFLQNLHLQVNMENVTDVGTTGLIQTTVNRLINYRDMLIHDPEDEIYGKSFGDLEHLESLALKGLGAQITEVTAFFGFKGMKKLKNLLLYGKQRIGKDGKKFLTKLFPRSEGCSVRIIE